MIYDSVIPLPTLRYPVLSVSRLVAYRGREDDGGMLAFAPGMTALKPFSFISWAWKRYCAAWMVMRNVFEFYKEPYVLVLRALGKGGSTWLRDFVYQRPWVSGHEDSNEVKRFLKVSKTISKVVGDNTQWENDLRDQGILAEIEVEKPALPVSSWQWHIEMARKDAYEYEHEEPSIDRGPEADGTHP